MKNNWIKSLVFSFAILFCIIPTVNAATIIETTTEDAYDTIENNSIIVGVTKFESGEVLTAGKVALATYNYMLVNSGETNIEVPKIYYYLEDAWYEIDDENDTTLLEDTSLVDELDIYFVNNEEKMLEIPVTYNLESNQTLLFESNDSEKDTKIKYEDGTIYVPSTVKNIKVILKNTTTLEETELEIWSKKEENSSEFNRIARKDMFSLEELKVLYVFEYYDSFTKAMNFINDVEDDKEQTEEENAIVAICKDGNNYSNMVLLNNAALNETLNLNKDTNIYLNGYKITSNAIPAINVNANVNIDAVLDGSKIETSGEYGKVATIINVESGECTLSGGEYKMTTMNGGTKTNQASAIIVDEKGSIDIDDAKILAKDIGNGSAVGVYGKANSKIEIRDSEIEVEASGESLENCGIYTFGDAIVTDSSIIAKADFVANAAGNDYASSSRGIYSEGLLELNNCYVWGAHSGVTSKGSVIVDGGTYEGYGHGAFYLAGANTISYIYNATLNWAPMLEGIVADEVAGTNGAGFYIGGASNVITYFDNCKFNSIGGSEYIYKGSELPFYGIVLRNSGGEQNNSAYVSNCEFVNATKYAYRIGKGGGATLRVYNGVGNDYSGVENIYNYEEKYIETNESYAK